VGIVTDIVRLTIGAFSTAITRDAGDASFVESAPSAGKIVTSQAIPTSDTRIMFQILLWRSEPSDP
jgi:hypothetical protein